MSAKILIKSTKYKYYSQESLKGNAEKTLIIIFIKYKWQFPRTETGNSLQNDIDFFFDF
jgi:hypothetical protein